MSHSKIAVYKDNSRMVRKTKQVVLLYEGAIRFVQQARQAILNNDIETRYNSLVKACDILTGLQLSLDFEKGGPLAKTLYDYYSGLDMRLLSVHQSNSVEMCDLCIKHLKMMCSAWEEVDQKYGEEESKNKNVEIPSKEMMQPVANAVSNMGGGLGLSVSA